MLTLEPNQIWTEIARLFPEMAPAGGRILDIGFRSIVAELESGHILLIGRHRGAARTYEKEFRVLPTLRDHLPCRIPDPDWFSLGTGRFPFGAERYRKIPGVALSPENLGEADLKRIGTGIGEFLDALHSISTIGFDHLKEPELHLKLMASEDHYLSVLSGHLSKAECDLVKKWFDTVLEESSSLEDLSVPIHGDLWYENIVVDDNRRMVTGILDFEAFAIGDPAKDFAPLLYLGREFLDSALISYAASNFSRAEFRQRIRRYWELRELEGAVHCADLEDRDELEVSIAKIRKGPILNQKARPERELTFATHQLYPLQPARLSLTLQNRERGRLRAEGPAAQSSGEPQPG